MPFSRLSDWLAWQETLHPSAIDLSLDRLKRVLERLDWRGFHCPVITISGTKGKGSCAAFLESLFGAAGYRVGLFTSPHLRRYNERIHIAGEEISDASLCVAFERIDAARGEITLTYFEFNALAALLCFATAQPDVIVLEVGMGGRLDAVNVIDADVAIVTSIGLDHCEWLGYDLESIGREKAGILRAGRPAIFGALDMPRSVAERADQLGAHLVRFGRDFSGTADVDETPVSPSSRRKPGPLSNGMDSGLRRNDGESLNRTIAKTWTWHMGAEQYAMLPMPALRGEVQLANASSALAALSFLSDRLPVSRDAIETGLREVRLPGRFQSLADPKKPSIEWIIDVAHNALSAQTLADNLASCVEPRRTIAVFAALADKDISAMVNALRVQVDVWIAASLSSARALPVTQLAARLADLKVHVAASADGVIQACELARTFAQAGDRVLVFGSFLTVGPALEWLAGSH